MPENPSNHAAQLTNGPHPRGRRSLGIWGGGHPLPFSRPAAIASAAASRHREGVFYTFRAALFSFRLKRFSTQYPHVPYHHSKCARSTPSSCTLRRSRSLKRRRTWSNGLKSCRIIAIFVTSNAARTGTSS